MDKHESLKKRIKENPGLIGLENILGVEEEVPCYNEDGNLVCQPDLIFELENGKVLVEVKSSNHRRALAKLDEQLRRGYNYFKKQGEFYDCIGVYLENDEVMWYKR
ncbi:MAG: hypothetical protein KAT77_04665 [Nanoarchaeota archaeon]|nr:hypothetical protein [Nanoarchaeota archaeon]